MNLSKYKRWRAFLHREWLRHNNKKESRLILCIYTQSKSMNRWRTLIHRRIMKQWVRNDQIKRKQTCSLSFVNVFKFQNMGGQGPKICDNWPLTSPCLQRCIWANHTRFWPSFVTKLLVTFSLRSDEKAVTKIWLVRLFSWEFSKVG